MDQLLVGIFIGAIGMMILFSFFPSKLADDERQFLYRRIADLSDRIAELDDGADWWKNGVEP